MKEFMILNEKEIKKINSYLIQNAEYFGTYCSFPRWSKEKTPYDTGIFLFEDITIAVEKSRKRLMKRKKPRYDVKICGKDVEKIKSVRKLLEDLII